MAAHRREPDIDPITAASSPARPGEIAKIGDVAAAAGIRRVHILAWRDLDDVEAGGSEVHAATVARLWTEAGLEVTMRTSYAQGHPPVVTRDGYRVVRRAGRYLIFPRAAYSELAGRHGPADALVEVWNGMPFFSPLWARVPRVVFLHHLHAEMWRMVLPPNLARVGEVVEYRVAPALYRRTSIVTLSDSSRQELVDVLGFRADRVSVVPPGVDGRFTPGGRKAAHPLVVAVGRLMPVKRFDLLIEVASRLRRRHPDLELVIVGEGYERLALEERVRRLDAESWVRLPGHLADDALVDLYRRAWVLASASIREGWGMTITEAAACGTPAVATDITGHRDAVVDGETGLLAASPDDLAGALDRLLGDADLRRAMARQATAHAARFTWEATAEGTMRALADAAGRRGRFGRVLGRR